VLERRSGNVELVRPDGKVGTLTQAGQPDRKIALQRRPVRDCLSEELRRLDPDEIYAETLKGLSKVVRGRAATPVRTTRRGARPKPPDTTVNGATAAAAVKSAAPAKAATKPRAARRTKAAAEPKA
jgi:hypothetical protein